MESFPNALVRRPYRLIDGLDDKGNASLEQLDRRGYEFAVGLNEYYAGAISAMAQQKHIVEYCPSDFSNRRFASLTSSKRWLQKAGGRAVFLLLQKGNDQSSRRLAGYSWTGYEERPKFNNYPITSAYRLGEIALGQGLASDYMQSTVSATRKLYTSEGLGLETWQSNERAIKTYERLGFIALEIGMPELRPSLLSDIKMVLDQRIYMGYVA